MRKAGIIGGLEFFGCYITLKFLLEDFLVKALVPRLKDNPLIDFGLKSHQNIEICHFDPEDELQMSKFINDCEIVIHCGTPMELGIQPNGSPLYIPVIQKMGALLKVLRENTSVSKVFLLTSAAALSFSSDILNLSAEHEKKEIKKNKKANPVYKQARFHAEKASHVIYSPETRIEIVIVPPVEVKNNSLVNSREATIAGLRFIFGKSIRHDPVFIKILNQKVLHTVASADDLPDWIFSSLAEMNNPYNSAIKVS
jgi:dihydroflavonol-4-reductase